MATRYYEPRPFATYYAYQDAGVVVVAENRTSGRSFYITAPCLVYGVEFWYVVAGGPTIRAGLWRGHGASATLLASVDVTNCAQNSLVQALFASPVAITWADIATQRSATQGFQIGIWDTSGAGYQRSVSTKKIIRGNNFGSIGKCYMSWLGGGYATNPAAGFGPPDDIAAGEVAADPIILPDEDTYEYSTVHPYVYGAAHPGITVTAVSRTVGGYYFFKQAGMIVHGIRFYTHDAGAWTAKCTLWGPNPFAVLASATVGCSGAGVYDCMFASPYTVTDAQIALQAPGGPFTIGVFNTTNNNYTSVVVGANQIFPNTWGGFNTDLVCIYGYSYPYLYIGGDARPFGNLAQAIPIDPLVSEAA